MTQQQINHAQWNDPDNWSGPFNDLYFSKQDSRVWVPRKGPWNGWTMNLAQPRGAMWLYGMVYGVYSLLTLALIAVAALR